MPLRIERTTKATAPRCPVHALAPARADAFDDAYTLFEDDDAPRWHALVAWGEYAAAVPFREQLVWPAAGVAAIGGGAAVYFVDLATGALRTRLDVPSLFGHLALDECEPGVRPETLYVLSWTDVIAVAPSLEVRFWTRGVAVDGVVFAGAEGTRLYVGAEIDPPGGWFDVTLDATTGRELARAPASD